MRGLGLILAAMFAAGGASAAELAVTVRTPAGAPVPNAVVTVEPSAGGAAPRPSAEPLAMNQQNIAFSPFVLIVPVGATVTFPNQDKVRHHVYSFSAPHRFDLKLYGHEERRSEHFDKPGVVALGCNIHDKMAGYIVVVATRFAVKTDAAGMVQLKDLPAGAATLKVWAATARAPGGTVSQPVTIAGGAAKAEVTVDLRPPPPGKQDH